MSFSSDFQEWLKKRADAGNLDSKVALAFFAKDEEAQALDEAWDEVMEEGGRDLIEAGKAIINAHTYTQKP